MTSNYGVVGGGTGNVAAGTNATVAGGRVNTAGDRYATVGGGFYNTAGGGHDSGWQDSPTYEDTGLSPSTQYTYTVTARDKSVNQNATAPSTEMSAVTDPPGADINVNDIAMSWRNAGANYFGQATVWIVESGSGANVEGATVCGQWSGDVSGPAQGVTLADGTVLLESSPKKKGGTFTFTVTDVVKSGRTYNPSLNVETTDTIVVP